MKTTKTPKLILILIAFLLTTQTTFSQTYVGYSLNKYPVAEVYNGVKAKINYKSNPTARDYRTMITQGYKNSKIDFAGHYTMTFWGAGTGMTVGAMVDNITGNVYDLPLTEDNSYRGCYFTEKDSDNDNIFNNKNSKLFVTFTCTSERNETSKTELLNKKYSIFLWDEAKKKFILLKEKSETKTQTFE